MSPRLFRGVRLVPRRGRAPCRQRRDGQHLLVLRPRARPRAEVLRRASRARRDRGRGQGVGRDAAGHARRGCARVPLRRPRSSARPRRGSTGSARPPPWSWGCRCRRTKRASALSTTSPTARSPCASARRRRRRNEQRHQSLHPRQPTYWWRIPRQRKHHDSDEDDRQDYRRIGYVPGPPFGAFALRFPFGLVIAHLRSIIAYVCT